MSFEIRNVLWTPVDEISQEDLQPIVSTLSDWTLGTQVIEEVGLANARVGLIDSPIPECRDFKHGRMVLARAIDLHVVSEAMQASRWFNAGQHVLKLSEQRQETCGGWRLQAAARIFGSLA